MGYARLRPELGIDWTNGDLELRDLEGYWKIWTYGVRKAFAIANQMDVTDEDIMSIPIGDVPPLKMK